MQEKETLPTTTCGENAGFSLSFWACLVTWFPKETGPFHHSPHQPAPPVLLPSRSCRAGARPTCVFNKLAQWQIAAQAHGGHGRVTLLPGCRCGCPCL